MGVAVNEYDFLYNVEVGKRQSKRVHKVSVGTQTDDVETEVGPPSPSIFSREFRQQR